MDMAETILSIQNVTKRFDAVTALDDISLQVRKGVFDPVGALWLRETTTLRIIAGWRARTRAGSSWAGRT